MAQRGENRTFFFENRRQHGLAAHDLKEQSLFKFGKGRWFGPPIGTLTTYFYYYFLLKREKNYVVMGKIDFFGKKNFFAPQARIIFLSFSSRFFLH